MAAITKGVDPGQYLGMGLFGGDRDNHPQYFAYVVCHFKLIDCSWTESAYANAEVCDRFRDVFCEVASYLTIEHLAVIALTSVGARDHLDVDLFAELQGLVAEAGEGCFCRGLPYNDDQVLGANGCVWS